MSDRHNRAYYLDIGTVKTIAPLLLRQYDPGVTLIVDSAKVERARVRFEFRRADEPEDRFATSSRLNGRFLSQRHSGNATPSRA
jgi:hypothetical protein